MNPSPLKDKKGEGWKFYIYENYETEKITIRVEDLFYKNRIF